MAPPRGCAPLLTPPRPHLPTPLPLCRRYWAELSDPSREKFVGAVGLALNACVRALASPSAPVADSDNDSGSDEEGDEGSVTSRRNGFKQLVFLLSEAALACARVDADAAAKADKPVRGKAKTGDANSNRVHVCIEKAVAALVAGVDSEFNRMWPLGVPEEVRPLYPRSARVCVLCDMHW